MTLGNLNLGEIWVFFRYRSFPITLNVLLLFAWVYLLIVFLSNREKKLYLYLAIATFVLFLKELVLFFTVRHVVFGESHIIISIYLRDWIVLETIAAFFFSMLLSLSYSQTSIHHKFDYPAINIFKNMGWVFLINSIVLALVLGFTYVLDDQHEPRIALALPFLSIMYFAYPIWISNRIRVNYTVFGGGWLNRHVHVILLFFLLMMIVLALFAIVGLSISSNVFYGEAATIIREIPNTTFHAIKTVAYAVYVGFIFFLLAKDYKLADAFEKMKAYVSRQTNSIGASMRRQVLRYEKPEAIIDYLLKEAAAYTQAQFAYFCYNDPQTGALRYFEYVCESSPFREVSMRLDLTFFLQGIIDRDKAIMVDEFDELDASAQAYFEFLKSDEFALEELPAENTRVFPCPIKSILASPIREGSKLLYTIVLINKKEDYFEEWKEETAYSFLEALAEDVRFLKEYMLEHGKFIAMRNEEFDRRMSLIQSTILQDINALLIQQLPKSKHFSVAVASAYKQYPLKTFVSTRTFKKKQPLILLADIEGDTAARTYLGGMLHAGFEAAAASDRSLPSILRTVNQIMSLSQRKNYVSASLYTYEEERRKLVFGNAAHTPILIFHIASDELIAYSLDDPPICVGEDMVYRDANTDINEGDLVITCSRELMTLKDSDGEEVFNAAIIGNIVKSIDEKDPETIANQLVQECEKMSLPLSSQVVFIVTRVGAV